MNKNAMLAVDIGNLDMEIAARVAQRYVLKEIFLVDAKISRDPLIVSPETLSLEHKCYTDSPATSDADATYIISAIFGLPPMTAKNRVNSL